MKGSTALFVLALAAVALAAYLAFLGQLTQPVATLFAAVLVPTLGLAGFRYQKMLDRQAEAISERRRVYLELIDCIHDFDRAHALSENGQLWDYHRLRDKIFLLAPDDVAEQMQLHRMGITYFARTESTDEFFSDMREAHDSSFFALLDVMRFDLDSSSKFIPSKKQ